jgi:hypothetical protein
MIDNYLKKLEEIITPRKYSINNINKTQREKSFESFRLNQSKSPNSRMKFLQKDSKNISISTREMTLARNTKSNSINTSQISPGSLNDNLGSIESSPPVDLIHIEEEKNSMNMSQICKQDPYYMKEIIIEERKKNMSYRYEIGELKRKIESLEKEGKIKQDMLNKLQRDKEIDSKYLIKLENMLTGIKDSKIREEVYTIDKDNTQKEAKHLIKFLYGENEKLKLFQSEIYKISKTYDEINSGVLSKLKEIENLFAILNDNINQEKLGKTDLKNIALQKVKCKEYNLI